MDVIVIDTRQLGDHSYLVHDGEVALVIDPRRDTDRVEKAAAEAGVRITHVAETHPHSTDEHDAAHLPGSVNIPLHELLARMGEVSTGRLWVHCGSGYRAGIAASLLQRAGKNPSMSTPCSLTRQRRASTWLRADHSPTQLQLWARQESDDSRRRRTHVPGGYV